MEHAKRPLLLGVVIVALAIAVVAWLSWRTPASAALAPAQEPREQPAPAAVALEAPPDEPAVERRELEQPSVPAAPPAPGVARVLGRCVSAEDGSALAGCSVKFTGSARNDDVLARHGPVDWTNPEPVVTGSDGRFEFVFVPPPPFQHLLEASCAGRAPRTAWWGAFEPGQVVDLGDVALARGYTIEGRVVDELGGAVQGVTVSLDNLPLPIAEGMSASGRRSARSAEDGRFELTTPIPAGTWSLDARLRGMKLVSPDTVTVVAGVGAAPLTVVMKAMPSIAGVVVDDRGDPVPGVYLAAALERSGRTASARTDEQGAFTIHAVDDDLRPVRLKVENPGPCEIPSEEGPAYVWGTQDVRIELVRALAFELTVLERESGAPVESFSVACWSDASRSSAQRDARLSGEHPGGRVTVDRIWRGGNQLVVHPTDRELAPSEQVAFEAVDPIAPITVYVDRRVPRRVHVATAAGEPVAGSKVELVRLGSDELKPDSIVIGPGAMGFSSNPEQRFHTLLADAVTDARGEAVVAVVPASNGLGLRLRGDRHLPLALSPVRFPPGEAALEVVVATGGRVIGSVAKLGYAMDDLRIALLPPGARPWEALIVPLRSDAAGGRFESPSLAPGAYRVLLSLEMRYKTEHGSNGQRILLEPELTTVTVGGDEVEVALDAAALAPGTIAGRVFLDGAPLADCRVLAERVTEAEGVSFGQFVPESDGRFEASGLPPGEYCIGIVVGDYKSSYGDVIFAGDSVTLGPAQTVQQSFHFERRRLALRLLRPDGTTPLPDTEVEIWNLYVQGARRTDASGWIHLDPVPPRSFTLNAGELQSGPLEMPAGQKDAQLDVVMQAR